MTITIGMRLCQLAQQDGLNEHQISRKLGVTPTVVHHWSTGEGSPNLRNAVALAHLVGRRLVAARDGQVVAVDEELARIGPLRKEAGMSQTELGKVIDRGQPPISRTERHAGPRMYLTTCQRYLQGCGYKVGIAQVVPHE